MQIPALHRLVRAACKLVAISACLLPVSLYAQTFPTQPVRIVVPFPAGGTTDILARLLATELALRWGQPVLVDNRAGASGTIFSEQLTRMPPDGYTLMLTATHHVINPGLYRALKYETRTDFTPIAQVAAVPNVLVVHPSFPAKTVQDLITYTKANPGKVNFGSTGIGGANHLSGELFKSMAAIEMVHIPYKGGAPALNDLLGGQITVMFDSVPAVLQHIQVGNLRALGVTSATRSAALPDIPTIDEAGVTGFEATSWFGLYAPGGMSQVLANKLSIDVLTALQADRLQNAFAQRGAAPGTMSQPQFAAFVDAEITKWSNVIRTANVTIE